MQSWCSPDAQAGLHGQHGQAQQAPRRQGTQLAAPRPLLLLNVYHLRIHRAAHISSSAGRRPHAHAHPPLSSCRLPRVQAFLPQASCARCYRDGWSDGHRLAAERFRSPARCAEHPRGRLQVRVRAHRRGHRAASEAAREARAAARRERQPHQAQAGQAKGEHERRHHQGPKGRGDEEGCRAAGAGIARATGGAHIFFRDGTAPASGQAPPK